ncbi:MAG: hypothetical protein JWM44_2665 [Bacilli bacterium]|nr:hypothetical protein [Bacilli bacterium]
MNGKAYINYQFREMMALGNSADEALSSLKNDENVNPSDLEEFLEEGSL